LKNLIANNFPNTIIIVCDQYHGNCCGNAGDFWNDYAGYYGITLNPTNFMDVIINNGGGNSDCTTNGFTSSDFNALFTNYESHGDNTAWLYAGTPHAPSNVQNFMTNVAVTPQVQWEQQFAVELRIGLLTPIVLVIGRSFQMVGENIIFNILQVSIFICHIMVIK